MPNSMKCLPANPFVTMFPNTGLIAMLAILSDNCTRCLIS